MIRSTLLATAATLALAAAPMAAQAQSTQTGAQTGSQAGSQTDPILSDRPIVETIGNNSSAFAVATLLIKRAGLEETLNSGEYTLFVPSDNAFAKLPDGVLQSLLNEGSKEKLASLLQNHVVEGKLEAGAFIDKSQQLTTLAGNSITVEGKGELLLRQPAAPTVKAKDGQVYVDFTTLEAGVPLVSILDAGGGMVPGADDDDVEGAVVILPDITASNGVIHAVSEVLVPKGFTDGM